MSLCKYVFNASRKSLTLIKPFGAFLAKALNDRAMSSGEAWTWIFFCNTDANSSKSISPLLSASISRTMVCNSTGSKCSPTLSSKVSNSSTEIVPELSHSTSSGLRSLEFSAARCLHSCLNKQKICRNSSMSSDVMPRFCFCDSLLFSGCSFSAALSARSNSFKLTSPPPSLSIFFMTKSNSWSDTSKPSVRKPSRNSGPSRLPSPLASIFLKRSLARMRFFFKRMANCLRISSASAWASAMTLALRP
mmetsp:Transcript_96650/g.295620  ORF Transcript_96650/g.295620 Transcript_96650/m.295620 type:complete len:248 (-) Transcript_96650:61-804(-)